MQIYDNFKFKLIDRKCKNDCVSKVTLLYYSKYIAPLQSGEICVALALFTYVYPVLSLCFRTQLQVSVRSAVACQTRARVVVSSLWGSHSEFFLRFTDVEHNTYVNVCVVEQLFGKRSIILRNNDFKYIRIK